MRRSLLVMLAVVGALGSGWACAQSPQPDGPDPASAGVVLLDGSAEGEARVSAARALLERGETGPIRAALGGEGGEGGVEAALRALAERAEAPSDLEVAVLGCVESVPAGARVHLARALRHFPSPGSVRALIGMLERPGTPEEQIAAQTSLRHITGLRYGGDVSAWRGWFAEAEFLSPAQWHARLAAQLRRTAERLRGERDAARAGLVSLYRRLYVATPAADRGPFLAELLGSSDEELRNLGFEFAHREVQSARTPNGEVAAIVRDLLKHPSARVRERAARLINPLAPSDGGVAVAAALATETDAEAASAMLTAVAQRWPTPAAREAVLRWIAEPSAAREAAIQAALSLLAAGHLEGESERGRVLAALRGVEDGSLSAGGMRLLAAIGDEGDRRRLMGLLGSPTEAVRRGAAEALEGHADAVDALVSAARADPGLLPSAARAVRMHRATPEGFRALAGLSAPDRGAFVALLGEVAQAMAPADRLAAADGLADADLRERLLGGFESLTTDEVEASVLVRGLVLLAKTRCELGQHDRALAVLESVGRLAPEEDTAALRVRALVALGRGEEALGIEAPAGAWVEGVRDAQRAGRPAAGAMAALALERLSDRLSDEQRAFLESVAPKEEPPEVEGAGEESTPPPL